MVDPVITQADCFMDTENVQHEIEKAFAIRTHIIRCFMWHPLFQNIFMDRNVSFIFAKVQLCKYNLTT